MNLTQLKNYAPAARRAFIEAVTRRAGVLGIRKDRVEEVSESGDIALIGGLPFPRSVVPLRRHLLDRIAAEGFDAAMEAMAYTWFNRFVAFRFMELHGYFDHGYRVLSHPEGGAMPEILQHAEHVHFSGLDQAEVVRLKLAGNQDEELYRLLLLAQCQELNRLLPDIFSRLDDVTILLLPDHLLHTDSLVRQLVAASDPEDWQEVEVLGWLYQFYISEKKDAVMARKSAVPTEDIPAVTQLFTPHWIVRYLVENSLGRLWLLNRPGSRLREHMPYYIESEAETDFLRISKPEDIKIVDPAVGSAHMLTYAFDLLYLIYEEEGYTASEIPGLILQHNLHGLEICPRAAQLAELALVFKARANSRRFFQPEQFVRPNITELKDVRFEQGELREYIQALGLGELFNQPMLKLLHQFEEAKNFGSLIQPCVDAKTIAYARGAIAAKEPADPALHYKTHGKVLHLLDQAEALTQRYHVVVSNPPYQEQDDMNPQLRQYVGLNFSEASTDLCCAFILRNQAAAQSGGIVAMITMQSWMFLDGSVDLREQLFPTMGLLSMLHLGPRAFDAIPGEVVQTTAFVFDSLSNNGRPVFHRLVAGKSEEEKRKMFLSGEYRFANRSLNDLREITGSPLAYWASDGAIKAFDSLPALASLAEPRQGLITGETARFLRYWHEVNSGNLGLCLADREAAKASGKKWFPQDKGGPPRRWFGNNDFVVNWLDDGNEIRNFKTPGGRLKSRPQNLDYYFRSGVTWTKISSGAFAVRFTESGFIFSDAGMKVFHSNHAELLKLAGFLNSRVADKLLGCLSETINYEQGNIARLPVASAEGIPEIVSPLIELARADWDNFETSWDFRDPPLLRPGLKGATLEASWRNWEAQSTAAIRRMQELETENNRLFIAAYGLEGELQPEVPEAQITLARAEPKKDMAAFLSYAVGCMMGRYALEQPCLILADAGDTLAEFQSKVPHTAFPPDEDGILPITDRLWFDDDVAQRVEEFLRVTFGPETLEANLAFLAASLGPKGQETPAETLRRYLADEFYKNHLSTERACGYKNRPIYWLFSSGKERAFQCLVYLHRYQPGTLARMRTEYVIPLQGKLNARIKFLGGDVENGGQGGEIAAATSSVERKKLQTELTQLKKQQVELLKFDEQLRHYADQRIALDLDDGVKVNYAKFGPLVAETKKICGTKEED